MIHRHLLDALDALERGHDELHTHARTTAARIGHRPTEPSDNDAITIEETDGTDSDGGAAPVHRA